jgi:hypothetical protein
VVSPSVIHLGGPSAEAAISTSGMLTTSATRNTTDSTNRIVPTRRPNRRRTTLSTRRKVVHAPCSSTIATGTTSSECPGHGRDDHDSESQRQDRPDHRHRGEDGHERQHQHGAEQRGAEEQHAAADRRPGPIEGHPQGGADARPFAAIGLSHERDRGADHDEVHEQPEHLQHDRPGAEALQQFRGATVGCSPNRASGVMDSGTTRATIRLASNWYGPITARISRAVRQKILADNRTVPSSVSPKVSGRAGNR